MKIIRNLKNSLYELKEKSKDNEYIIRARLQEKDSEMQTYETTNSNVNRITKRNSRNS